MCSCRSLLDFEVQMGVSERCRSGKEEVLKVKEGGFGHGPEVCPEDDPEVVWTDPLVIKLRPSGASGGPTMNLQDVKPC